MNQPVEPRIPGEGPMDAPECRKPDPAESGRTFLRARPELHARYAIGDVLVQPMPEGAVMDPGLPAPKLDAAHAIHAVIRDEVERHVEAIICDNKA
ncbi:hypothetical protein [Zoogloea dura]|uniref:Uncharacterized protein n=1 Tax=Zoogloea dura TaxID=2728840 RepID=A0A848G0B9_9RHOO|nr:hypothetical protein [Zoogloea dura]NML24505.1 hypothetical protein [Zoogloea dura]